MPNFDIIIRTVLDKGASAQVEKGSDKIASDLSDVQKVVVALNKTFEKLEVQMKQATSIKDFESLERQLKDVEKQVNETTKAYSLQARVLRAEAASLTSDFEKARLAQIKSIGGRIGGASRAGLALTVGAGIGILAESNRFAKEAEETGKATQATREWTRATEELAQARARVDTVLLRESLPLLKQAAEIASQAADFIEQNPVIIRAALETGKIVAGLSVLGILASKGISLYADTKALLLGSQELAAAKLQDLAADKQLVAARLRAGVGGVDVPGGGAPQSGGPGLLNTIGLIVAGLAASAAVVTLVDQILEKSKFGPARQSAIDRARDQGARIYPGILPPKEVGLQAQLNRAQDQGNTQEIKRLRNELDKLGDQAKVTADDLQSAVTGLAGSAHESEIVSAFEQWKADDARIVAEAAAQRVKIIADSEKQVVAETRKYANQVASINASADKRAQSITSNFLAQSAQDEANYQENRAKIIRDGGKEIREIEEAHQERLRKLTKDHNERVEDLTASRDALGLAKEQRRFNEQRAEENRNTRAEIAKHRTDLAERLAELDHEHQIEQAQRLAQFQEALAENEAQRKEQLKQAAEAHAEELNQIRAQRAQQLRELQEGLNAERLRRREVFIAEVRDLDAALLGEKNLKARYYTLMLADADRFLAAYRAKLASGTAVAPAHDYTGYAYQGIYRMAANGQPEYVLSGAATRAAENIIGGGLTQDALLATLARGAGGGRSLTIQDNSRFDGRISSAQVRTIKRETREEIVKEFIGA